MPVRWTRSFYIDPNCTNLLSNSGGFTGIYIQYGGGVSALANSI